MELPAFRKTAAVLLPGILLAVFAAGGCRPAGPPEEPSAVAPSAAPEKPEKAVGEAFSLKGSDEASAPVADAEEVAPKPAADKPAAKPAGEGLLDVEPPPGPTFPSPDAGAGMAESPEPAAETDPPPRDLGPPLVDDPEQLVELHPAYRVWFDKEHKSVVMLAEVCQRKMTLELFACLKGSKEHESILAVPTMAFVVHAGLLAAGAEPGNPVRFYPEYLPARGPEIEVSLRWKDDQGRIQRARGQDWVRDIRSQKTMEYPWVFAGSHFVKDEQTGEQYYRADGEGDLICVSNFPTAVLDIPVKSSDANTELMFECFTERIPPVGTPVTMVLTPKQAEKSGQPAAGSEPKEEKSGKKSETKPD